ncbi:transcriptional regulator, LysR family [Alteromonadaceae bacterium Bs31]|nr:transcriptional regulator, LysR family [Alteromonadaceae bacterium Bs31]
MGQLEEMHVFVRVVEAGGLSKAAQQLGVAKSAISRRLKELEGRLGVELLHRTTRSSSLTEAGRQYYEGALAVLGDVAELNALTSDSNSQLEGKLHIAAPLSFGLAHLAPAVEEFAKAHSLLSMQLNFSDARIDVVEQGVDLALRIGELPDSSLRARKISPIRMCLCASPDYIRRRGTPKSHDDLLSHDLLRYDSPGGSQWRLLDQQELSHKLSFQPKFSANNGDFLRDMAIAGMGIIATPTFIVWQALREGSLVKIMDNYSLPLIHAYALYPATRYLSQRARLFIDFLVERFGDKPYWDV